MWAPRGRYQAVLTLMAAPIAKSELDTYCSRYDHMTMPAADSKPTVTSLRPLWRAVRFLWIGAAVVVLTVSLRAYDGTPNSDAEELLAWGMLVLSVPAGLLYSAVFAVLASLLYRSSQTVISTSYVSMVVSWAALFALGYSQWFVLAPWAARKLRASR